MRRQFAARKQVRSFDYQRQWPRVGFALGCESNRAPSANKEMQRLGCIVGLVVPHFLRHQHQRRAASGSDTPGSLAAQVRCKLEGVRIDCANPNFFVPRAAAIASAPRAMLNRLDCPGADANHRRNRDRGLFDAIGITGCATAIRSFVSRHHCDLAPGAGWARRTTAASPGCRAHLVGAPRCHSAGLSDSFQSRRLRCVPNRRIRPKACCWASNGAMRSQCIGQGSLSQRNSQPQRIQNPRPMNPHRAQRNRNSACWSSTNSVASSSGHGGPGKVLLFHPTRATNVMRTRSGGPCESTVMVTYHPIIVDRLYEGQLVRRARAAPIADR